jgi:hypothetical protein
MQKHDMVGGSKGKEKNGRIERRQMTEFTMSHLEMGLLFTQQYE